MDLVKNIVFDFSHNIIENSKLYDNPYTSLPTFIFLAFSLIFGYQLLRKRSTSYHRWRIRVYAHFKFHVTFYVLAITWFTFLKMCRRLLAYLEDYIETKTSSENQIINKTLTRACFLTMLLALAHVPVIFVYLNYLYDQEIPNFLMWVSENPWHRHELGLSGQYLITSRTRRFEPPESHNNNYNRLSYRTRNSASYETIDWHRTHISKVPRKWHSMSVLQQLGRTK